VQVNQYRVGPDEKKELAMTIAGEGMDVELTVSKVVIHTDVKTTLLDVSDDFMAGGKKPKKKQEGEQAAVPPSRNVVITSDGPMTYEHPAEKATFVKNVVATTTDREIKSESLVISMGRNEGSERLQVTGLTAEGNVQFKFGTTTTFSDSLVWDSVTQAGVLTGKDSRVVEEEFVIKGARLTFFRLNSRFQVEGPGTLHWNAKAPEKEPEPLDVDAEKEAPAALISPGDPLDVVWEGGMTYDATEASAVFSKAVKATQKDSTIVSDALEVQFGEKQSIKTVIGRDNVRVTQSVDGVKRVVNCDRAEWDAGTGGAKFSAAENKQVTVLTGEEKLVSSQVAFDAESNTISCSAGGQLDLEGLAADGGEPEPIKVTWTKSMRYHRAQPMFAEFEGDVVADRPEQRMKGDVLRVDFDEKMKPVTITSRKNAVLDVLPKQEGKPGETPAPEAPAEEKDKTAPPNLTKTPTQWRLTADVIIGRPQKDLLGAEGAGLLELLHKDRPKDSVRWKKAMAADFRQSLATFTGTVDARFSGSTLQCDSLRLEFDEQRELRHVYSKDNVVFVSAGEEPWKLKGQAAEAVFGAGSMLRQVIATKDVEVQDADRVVKSQVLTLYFTEDQEKGGAALSRAVAKKDVSVRYTGDNKLEADSDNLEWDVKSDRYTLTGDPSRLKQAGIEIQGQKILIDRKSGTVSMPSGQKPATTTVEGAVP